MSLVVSVSDPEGPRRTLYTSEIERVEPIRLVTKSGIVEVNVISV